MRLRLELFVENMDEVLKVALARPLATIPATAVPSETDEIEDAVLRFADAQHAVAQIAHAAGTVDRGGVDVLDPARGEVIGETPGGFGRLSSRITPRPELFEIFGETLIPRTRFITTKGDPDAMRQYLSRVNREHEAVFIAIERQDPDTARAAMRMHLVNVKEGLRIAYEGETGEAEERG